MTKKLTLNMPAPQEPSKKKLSRKEKDEAFRLLNENFSKAMDHYFAALDKVEDEHKEASSE